MTAAPTPALKKTPNNNNNDNAFPRSPANPSTPIPAPGKRQRPPKRLKPDDFAGNWFAGRREPRTFTRAPFYLVLGGPLSSAEKVAEVSGLAEKINAHTATVLWQDDDDERSKSRGL